MNHAPASPSSARLATVLMLAVVIVWGWTFVLVKDATASYGTVPFLAVRFCLAALCLLPWYVRRPVRSTLRVGFCIGLVLGASFLLQTLGLERTTASSAGLITGLFVVFAPLAGFALFRARTAGVLWIAIALSLAGLTLLTGATPAGLGRGELLLLGCAAGFGLHVALLDRHSRGHDTMVLAFGQMCGAAASLSLLWVVRGPVRPPPSNTWFALVVTGVLASAAAYVIQSFAQRHLNSAQTSVLMLLETLAAVAFGILLHGDQLTAIQFTGAGLMLAAAWVVSRRAGSAG